MGAAIFPSGATPEFQEHVRTLAEHPALAVWEGPDEVVWNFTAYSGLWRQDQLAVFPNEGEWWMQTPLAIQYSEERAAEIMPNMREAVEFIRSVDPQNRQVWINEARDSDLKFVRQYIDFVDITGCDDYPIRADGRPAVRVADATDRWRQAGRVDLSGWCFRRFRGTIWTMNTATLQRFPPLLSRA